MLLFVLVDENAEGLRIERGAEVALRGAELLPLFPLPAFADNCVLGCWP